MKKLKGINGKLDDAWSLAVKARAGFKCEKCRVPSPLNSHHIYTRKKMSTRWSMSNGICLCVSCHTFGHKFSAHGTPVLFVDWLRGYKGERYVDALTLLANLHKKWTYEEKLDHLAFLKAEIKRWG